MHERKEKFLKQNEERGAQFYTTKRRISENCKRDEDPTASLYPIPLSPPPPPLAPIWITSPQVGTMQKVGRFRGIFIRNSQIEIIIILSATITE